MDILFEFLRHCSSFVWLGRIGSVAESSSLRNNFKSAMLLNGSISARPLRECRCRHPSKRGRLLPSSAMRSLLDLG